ncbi:MAG: VapB-type antitoxin [Candidatus Bathyarchaeia archaeon]
MSVKITVRIQKNLKERMDKLTHVNWSEIIRRAIEEKVREEEVKQALMVMDEISSKAKPEKPTAEIIREFRDKRCPTT